MMEKNDKYLIAAYILFAPFVLETINNLLFGDRLNMNAYIPPVVPAAIALIGAVPFAIWFWKVMKE